MNLLYVSEHCTCENYDSDTNPIIEILHAENTFARDMTNISILYILNGVVDISYGMIENHRLTKGDFMMFPPRSKLTGRIVSPMHMMIFKMNDKIALCEKYNLDKLYTEQNIINITHTHLQSNPIVKAYIDSLNENFTNGLRCIHFLTTKTQELLYYLRLITQKMN